MVNLVKVGKLVNLLIGSWFIVCGSCHVIRGSYTVVAPLGKIDY